MKPRTSGERKLLIGVEVLALLLSQDIVWTIISAILAFFTKYSQTAFRDKHALVFFTIQIIFGFVYMFLTVFSVNDSNKAVSDIFNRPIPKKILDVCATGLLKINYVWEKIEDRSCGNVDHREIEARYRASTTEVKRSPLPMKIIYAFLFLFIIMWLLYAISSKHGRTIISQVLSAITAFASFALYVHGLKLHPGFSDKDEGISGTDKSRRPKLERLMQDCKSGKIDMVITKSISRFSRNTTDCLELVRKLLAQNIPIWFEKEYIQNGENT